MSISYHCDGCNTAVETPVKVGKITPRDYCAECAVKAEDFVAAEEDLRRVTHERFIDARAVLIATASDGGFKLPDVL